MYLCRTLTDTPLKAIGALLGGKDHASVNHGVKKIENELKTDEALNNTVNIIKKEDQSDLMCIIHIKPAYYVDNSVDKMWNNM